MVLVLLGDRGSVLKSFFIVFTLSHHEAALQASSCPSGLRVLRDCVYFGITCTSGLLGTSPGTAVPGYRLFRPFASGLVTAATVGVFVSLYVSFT